LLEKLKAREQAIDCDLNFKTKVESWSKDAICQTAGWRTTVLEDDTLGEKEGERRAVHGRERPENWNAKMNYVLTMDERCEALKDFGVIFYEKDCDDVATTL
jgi:hypothetical protein